MNDLSTTFVDVIDRLHLPEVDLTPGVLDHITAETAAPAGPASPQPRSWWNRPVVAAAVVLLLGLVVVTTPVGQAVADWFGIGATRFEIDPTVEDNGASGGTVGSNAVPGGVPADPDPDIRPIESLGRPTAVLDHRQRGRIYLWEGDDGESLSLSVRQVDNSIQSIKSLAGADDVEFLAVERADGRELFGVWVGAPHELSYPIEGLDVELSVDSGPVLIWLDGDVELRLEGPADRSEALTLAAEITDGTSLLSAE